MSRTIITIEFWRVRIGESPVRTWRMDDPHIAGGMTELFDWASQPGYVFWGKPATRFEVRYWPPDRIISIMKTKGFPTRAQAQAYQARLLRRGYILRESDRHE